MPALVFSPPFERAAGGSYATSLALSITGSTATGATASVVITPNGPIQTGGGTATIAITSGGGTLGSTSVTLTAGSSGPFTTTISRSTDGTTALSLSNNIGLTNSPSTASYTTTTAAPAGSPAAFTLTSSTSGTLPFAVGYALRQGDVPSGQDIAISGASAKASILSTWPDGSAKIALIAGTYTSAGSAVTVTPSAGTNAAGSALTGASVQTAMGANTAVVDCGSFGTVTFSGADFASPFKTHAATSAFGEFIYRKPVGSDAHLVAWLHVRLWASGALEFLPVIENGYFNVASPTNKSATYSFTLGGTSRFSAAIDLPNHCRTPLVSGTALSHWLGTDPGVVAKHDAAYLMATELVPSYFATVDPSAAAVTGLPSTFAPLQQGGYPASMGSAGYDPSIGLLPEWDVLALTTTATTVWAAIQRNAYSAGRYGIHHRDETTNRPPRFSSYPTTVLGDGTEISSTGSSTTSTFTPTATGTLPAAFAPSHMPSMGFMAYLITGRWYHMETMQFVATANHFRSSTAPRENASGILQTWSATSTRGAAWGLRALAQAACCTPDSDTTLRTELLNAYAANIAKHHATYVAGSAGAMGFMQPYSNYTSPVYQNAGAGSTSTSIVLPGGTSSTAGEYAKVFANGGHWTITIGGETRNVTAWSGGTFTATVSPAFTVPTAGQYAELHSNHWFEASWQQDFYTAALGYTMCLGLNLDSTTQTKLTAFFAWKAKSVVGRFGGTAANEYLYRDAAAYEFPVAESESWTNFYTDWGKVWTDSELQNARGSKVMGDRSLRGTTTDLSSYWGNLQPALAYCIRHGIYGAAEARSLMMGAPNWPAMAATGNDYPVWAVRAPVAAWRVGQATNAWREILNTKLSDQPGIDTGASSGKQDAWNSFVLIPELDSIRTPGTGGHADYAGNEVDGIDMRAAAPAWTQLIGSSPSSAVTVSPAYSAYYSDGRPSSLHTYYSPHWINSIQRIVRMWGGSTSYSGNPAQEWTAWNEATQAWDARSLWQTDTTIGYSLSSGYAYAKHPRTEEVFIWVYNADIRKWTPGVPGTFTTLVSGPSNPAPSASAAAIDPTRGTNGAGEMFVLGGGAGGTMCRVFDIGNNSLRTITLSGVDISTGRPGIGLFYSAATDRYYACVANPTTGALVYVITPSSSSDTWACSLLSTTGGGAIPETVGTDSGGAYPWGKFLYSPRTGCAYFAPRWGANLWALKLHEV